MYVCMYVFLEVGEEREEQRERTMDRSVASRRPPQLGAWPETQAGAPPVIKPVTFRFAVQCSTHQANTSQS